MGALFAAGACAGLVLVFDAVARAWEVYRD
jgi:hypothetical protein